MCTRMWVSGRVQGVGYRDFARRAAAELAIRGYARNLADGRVEVLACGSNAALERFEACLREGPRWSSVNGIEQETAAHVDAGGFTIG